MVSVSRMLAVYLYVQDEEYLGPPFHDLAFVYPHAHCDLLPVFITLIPGVKSLSGLTFEFQVGKHHVL